MRKLKQSSGETLVETLTALLLITLSSALFLHLTLTAGQISSKTKQQDALYQEELSAAEAQQTVIASGTVTVDGRSYAVDYFSSGETDASLISYSAAEDEP